MADEHALTVMPLPETVYGQSPIRSLMRGGQEMRIRELMDMYLAMDPDPRPQSYHDAKLQEQLFRGRRGRGA